MKRIVPDSASRIANRNGRVAYTPGGRESIPPTAVTTEVDPELPQIDLVTGEAREWTPGPTLSNSFGFGGHNGTLVLAPA